MKFVLLKCTAARTYRNHNLWSWRFPTDCPYPCPTTTWPKRNQINLHAVAMYSSGISLRKSAIHEGMPKSTFHRKCRAIHQKTTPTTHQNRALIDEEENVISEELLRRGDTGKGYTKTDIADARQMIFEALSPDRQIALPFKDMDPDSSISTHC